MLFREMTAVYSDNHTKPINTLYGKMYSYWMLKKVVHIDTTKLSNRLYLDPTIVVSLAP